MVRVLSCHHFKSQKVGRCDGGIGVALADQIVIVAQEHLLSVYCSEHITNIPAWFAKRRAKESFGKGPLGGHFHFEPLPSSSSPAREVPHLAPKKDAIQETLTHSHSFPPVDLIDSISYNRKGHYLQCLERRDAGGDSFRVRIYFHWDRPLKGKPMKARIAGLVSPTGGEVDSESLVMIEIPPEPLFATIATASCQYSANLATLSLDGRVNIYIHRLKEGGGRGRVQYTDFDLAASLLLECVPSRLLAFALNHVGVMSSEEALIFKIFLDNSVGPSERKKEKIPQVGKATQRAVELNQTVFYNPKKLDPSQVIRLPMIEKENRKLREPPGYSEEFREEIRNVKTTLIVPQSVQNKSTKPNFLGVEDVLRLKRDTRQGTSSPLIHLSLNPQRVENVVGGTLCLMAAETEMLIYHLPEIEGCAVKRITMCPFTGPLQHLRFDSSFIHALTESGIETYSRRGLAEILSDTEGFSPLNNDCPMQEESPCLLGIRPFPGVRFIEANEHSLCLLSAPVYSTQHSPHNELWTIYLLESPPVDQFYEDAMRGAEAHKESSPEVYLTLLSEIHLFLRDLLNRRPQDEPLLREKYRLTTRLMGLQFLRNSTAETEMLQEDLLNRGIAFLQMAQTDAKFFFRHENQDLPKDPQLVSGIAKFLRLTLPLSGGEDFPPSLSRAVVDFLGANSLSDLGRVTIEAPWLRDSCGQRILTALKGGNVDGGGESGWRMDLALILVIVSVHGRDTEGIEEIMKLLKHAESLEKNMKISWILETRKNKVRLSDLAVSLAMTRTCIHTNVVAQSLEAGGGVTLDDMILAFHQGINLNADLSVKEALTKDLRKILEGFFLKRIETGIQKDDELRALHLLVSSYLPNILQQPAKRNALAVKLTQAQPLVAPTFDEPFGKVPSFIHVLVEEEPYASALAKENFFALASLILSPLGNVKGAKDLVLRAISNQSDLRLPFGFPLALVAETREAALDLLLGKCPEMLLVYAKETFGSSVEGWKLVVMKLKEKIGTHPTNQDLITTVTESVYLHLANSLSPSALEEVLEKEEEKDHFLDASKRVDLANAFADKVVQMSRAFLSRP